MANLPPPSWFAERADDFEQTTGQPVSDADPELLEEYHARVTHPSRAGEFVSGSGIQRMKDLSGGTTEQRIQGMNEGFVRRAADRPAENEARTRISDLQFKKRPYNE